MGKSYDRVAKRGRVAAPTRAIGFRGNQQLTFGGAVYPSHKDDATFSQILEHCHIVSAGARIFQDFCAQARWSFQGEDESAIEAATELLINGVDFEMLVRRAAMYRYWGYSIHEWTASRRRDGLVGFADIGSRSQSTILRFDRDERGAVTAVHQMSQRIPREKVLYLVDNSLNDMPEGLGLLHHVKNSALKLQKYETLEGFGYSSNLRGLPIGRVPYLELQQKVEDGDISQEMAQKLIDSVTNFVEATIRTEAKGTTLDSSVWQTTDETGRRPGTKDKSGVTLLQGASQGQAEVSDAIRRVTREIARILGIDAVLLGEDSAGSFALAKEKSSHLYIMVDSTLKALEKAFQRDLVECLWNLNGFSPETMPRLKYEKPEFKTTDEIISAAIQIQGLPEDLQDQFYAILGISREDNSE